MITRLCVLLLTLGLSGCGTFGTKVFPHSLPEAEQVAPGYYSGVRGNLKGAPIWWATEAPGGKFWTPLRKLYLVGYMLVDMPLSAAMDTAILPIEFLVYSIGGRGTVEPDAAD